MTREEGLHSIGLFVDEVMPALRKQQTRVPDAVQRQAVHR
jgi:hypothetical protein